MDKILCCVTDRDHALKAAQFAARISIGLGCPLVFLAVNKLQPHSGFAPMEQWTSAEIRQLFQKVDAATRKLGLKKSEQVSLDAFDVSQMIVDYAISEKITHIIVGTGNPPFLGRLLMGSVSEAVVSKAKCTVTVVR